MTFTCSLELSDGTVLKRKIVFPDGCFPYPGMGVGSHTVKKVNVCQGDLDGSGQVIVEFKRKDASDRVTFDRQGWKKEGER